MSNQPTNSPTNRKLQMKAQPDPFVQAVKDEIDKQAALKVEEWKTSRECALFIKGAIQSYIANCSGYLTVDEKRNVCIQLIDPKKTATAFVPLKPHPNLIGLAALDPPNCHLLIAAYQTLLDEIEVAKKCATWIEACANIFAGSDPSPNEKANARRSARYACEKWFLTYPTTPEEFAKNNPQELFR